LAMAAGSFVIAAPRPSEAAPYKVYSPHVVRGENEVEYRGFHDVDDDGSIGGTEQHVIALGRGFTDNWFSEIYSVNGKDPGSSLRHTGFEWENLFQLAEPGQYWADFGLLLEYEALNRGSPDEIAIGPIFEKAIGPWVTTLNFLFEQEVGSGRTSGTTFAYAARVRYLLRPQFEPAVEFFGEPGRFGHFGSFNGQEHWVGPAFYGSVGVGTGKKLSYSASCLFGETSVSSDNRAILRLEFEFF
ncbi:MAG TPA: hypothetical protein VFV71_09835, partial [Burkholderiales bacterium]|nr:hypothetical protein [Burkholderiales bacterium]